MPLKKSLSVKIGDKPNKGGHQASAVFFLDQKVGVLAKVTSGDH